ncbi:MAG: aminotransferase class V-fold PLP-dependent enzyme [Planctomycetaceae bacterium]
MNDLNSLPVNKAWPITDEAIRSVFDSMAQDGSWGRYHGPHCDRLREELGRMHDVDHVILCCSGTSAVELALRSVPVTTGDEVILAAYDFKANLVNVLTVGATPVLVDVLPGRPVMDLSELEKAITPRTKAILVSHLHGHLAPVSEIRTIAQPHGIMVIEDACQSPGALLAGQRAGTLGNIGVLSFGGSKLLTAGRGGALLTSDATLAQRIRLYTQRGNDAYPLSEMQAAILLPQLHQLDERNALRLTRVNQFAPRLLSQSQLKLTLTAEDLCGEQTRPVFYKLGLLLSDEFNGGLRERIAADARSLGVPLDPALPALHVTHSRQRFRAVGDLMNANQLHTHLMTLHHTSLMQSESEIELTTSAIRSVIDRAKQR